MRVKHFAHKELFLLSGGFMYDCVTKGSQVNVRVKSGLKDDLEILADYHGLTVSSFVHSVLVREVRKEKEALPHLFPEREHLVNDIRQTQRIAVLKETAK